MAHVLQSIANLRNKLTQSPSATEDLRDKVHTKIPASGPTSTNTGTNPGSHYHNSDKHIQNILKVGTIR